jgi:hypothetical protein
VQENPLDAKLDADSGADSLPTISLGSNHFGLPFSLGPLEVLYRRSLSGSAFLGGGSRSLSPYTDRIDVSAHSL